ncbi:hypothetical protein ACFVJH_27090 [Streptomyces decoyicus]|uniref:hypothetical protein n=1 Tax=Streptomyces decoyicus TaxID=249567 RepID=UPI0036378E74
MQQARRRAAADGGAAVDGFAVRKWRHAGVFGAASVQRIEGVIRALLTQVDEASAPSGAICTLRTSLNGAPSNEVPGAVKILLESVDQQTVVDVLVGVHDAGALWLADWGAQRLSALLRPDENAAPGSYSSSGADDPLSAFELFTSLTAEKTGTLPPRRVERLLDWVPLGVLDDLIDAGVVDSAHEPWEVRADGEEALYLQARLVPERLSRAQAERIRWRDRIHRDGFLAGEDVHAEEGSLYDLLSRVCEGDPSVLKPLENKLPRPLVLRLRKIQDGAQVGSWDDDIIADHGLWRLITSLWEPKAAVDPQRSSLHALMALRQAYDLICLGKLRKATAQVAKLIAYEGAEPSHAAEAWNMWAYLALLDEELDRAVEAQTRVTVDGPSGEANAALLQRRRAIPRNDRQWPTNPYLDLGLPHRSPHWNHRYRDLRREYAQDREAAARINRAMHRIRRAEQLEDWSDFYVLPLDPSVYELPYAVPASMVPAVAPMARTTAARSAADLNAVRRQAVADLLPALLTTPRRPDRHIRNIHEADA